MDLILERDRKLVAVECKLKEKPQEKDIQGIRKLKKFYGQDEVAKAYVAMTPLFSPVSLLMSPRHFSRLPASD